LHAWCPATFAFLSHGDLSRWLTDYGYAAVLVLVAIESVGVPVPGESMLILAAIYAGTTQRLSIAGVVAAAAAGAIVGDNLGYAVGRLGGWRLLRRYGHYVRIGESKLKLGRYLFMRHGGKVVFFGRFVGILRTYSAALAGANHMRIRRFVAFNASGGVIWAAVYGLGYYYAANAFTSVGAAAGVALIVIAVAVAAGIFLFIRARVAEWEERAEAALPGPLWEPRPRRTRNSRRAAADKP
jgi:membrane protein DedA with SNARE-associated domain